MRVRTTSRANSAGRAVTESHRPGFDRTVVLRRPGDGDTVKLGNVDLRVSTPRVEASPSVAGETALHLIPFRRLHLGLSGWRSLSAKTRVNLA
jgi:hypothetical protein